MIQTMHHQSTGLKLYSVQSKLTFELLVIFKSLVYYYVDSDKALNVYDTIMSNQHICDVVFIVKALPKL